MVGEPRIHSYQWQVYVLEARPDQLTAAGSCGPTLLHSSGQPSCKKAPPKAASASLHAPTHRRNAVCNNLPDTTGTLSASSICEISLNEEDKTVQAPLQLFRYLIF